MRIDGSDSIFQKSSCRCDLRRLPSFGGLVRPRRPAGPPSQPVVCGRKLSHFGLCHPVVRAAAAVDAGRIQWLCTSGFPRLPKMDLHSGDRAANSCWMRQVCGRHCRGSNDVADGKRKRHARRCVHSAEAVRGAISVGMERDGADLVGVGGVPMVDVLPMGQGAAHSPGQPGGPYFFPVGLVADPRTEVAGGSDHRRRVSADQRKPQLASDRCGSVHPSAQRTPTAFPPVIAGSGAPGKDSAQGRTGAHARRRAHEPLIPPRRSRREKRWQPPFSSVPAPASLTHQGATTGCGGKGCRAAARIGNST